MADQDCPTPKACRAHCCHGACLPAPQQAEPVRIAINNPVQIAECGGPCADGGPEACDCGALWMPNMHSTTIDAPQQQAEPVKRKPATGAESCAPSPSFQMTTQAEPERNFCPRCGKRLSSDGIYTCTPPQTKCSHCASPLFAAIQCRVCGRKEPK